jgi:hypothetical protein
MLVVSTFAVLLQASQEIASPATFLPLTVTIFTPADAVRILDLDQALDAVHGGQLDLHR